MTERKLRKYISSALSVLVVLFAVGTWLFNTFGSDNNKKAPAVNGSTQVHFVDVGQGDATLIISENEAMLVDTGERDSSDTLIKYLKEMNIDSLKYLVITHPHTDHMGEASDILNAVSVEKIIMPKVTGEMTPTNSTYKNFLKTVKRLNKKIATAKDETFELGKIKFNTYTTKQEHENLNNYSVLVKIVDEQNSFLITGDCEIEEENEMMNQGFDLKSTVLKAGHHGSYNSTSKKFLKYVNPEYAVISCAKQNKYGHPHDKTVKSLKKQTSNCYITADNGTIVFTSDGKGLSVSTEK